MKATLLKKPDEYSFDQWLDFISNRECLSDEQREKLRTHAMAIAAAYLKLAEETDLIERCSSGEWDFYKKDSGESN